MPLLFQGLLGLCGLWEDLLDVLGAWDSIEGLPRKGWSWPLCFPLFLLPEGCWEAQDPYVVLIYKFSE